MRKLEKWLQKIDMMHSSQKTGMFLLLMIALFLMPAPASHGEDKAQRLDAPVSAGKRVERERRFLYQAVDEMNKSQDFVKETTAALEELTPAAEALEPKRMKSDQRDFQDWYRNYASWLERMTAVLEADLAEHYSREPAGVGWAGRYEELAKGYQKLSGQLAGKVREMEAAQSKIEARMQKLKQAVQERRVLVEKDDLELAKELWPAYRDRPYDHREAVYKDLTDEEIQRFQYELRTLGEQQKSLEVITELGRYELIWLTLKIEDSASLNAVARAIAGDAPGPITEACRSAIRTYESDISTLKRKSHEIGEKFAAITRTGTLNTLDRLEELSRHYEIMKKRYERQIEWLRTQAGSYQADLVELSKGK